MELSQREVVISFQKHKFCMREMPEMNMFQITIQVETVFLIVDTILHSSVGQQANRVGDGQCVQQTSMGKSQPVVEGLIEGDTVHRPPEVFRRSPIFFFWLLSNDQFS
jgi:hypothetical protein